MKKLIYILIFTVGTFTFAQTNPCNCCTETHSQFDFWIGDWTVTDTKGNLAGTNSIKKEQNNCVLVENWTSAKGSFTGTSYNFYNSSTSQWEQIWVDNQGGSLYLKGNRKGNQMILKSDELTNKNGQAFHHKITWILNDDGSVRQLWETITADKVTVAFDGLYVKSND